jgi:L-rhamnono-1,4-lactonase
MAQRILDSHIHLWDVSAANLAHHAWMAPGSHLAKQYSTAEYRTATSPSTGDPQRPYDLVGVVYVETDRRVEPRSTTGDEERPPEAYAGRALDELRFLRGLVDGDSGGEALVRGIVAWAPLDRGAAAFRAYVAAARAAAGERAWARVVGFRFLVQGMRRREMGALVEDARVVEVLKEFGGKWCFDLGIDVRQGGEWQADMMEGLVRKVMREGSEVVFVLSELPRGREACIDEIDHLCKPDMERDLDSDEQRGRFERWKGLMGRFARHENVFMKLSGAFSEIGDQDPKNPWTVDAIASRIMPWVQHIIVTFTPQRIMFGSDWPVCNVRGPGDEKSWHHWRNVVGEVLRRANLSDSEKDRIWFGTAMEAYRIKM